MTLKQKCSIFHSCFVSNFKDPERVASPLFLSICKILAIILQSKVCEKLQKCSISYEMFTTTVFITFPILVFPYALMADLRGRRRRQGEKAVRFAESSKQF